MACAICGYNQHVEAAHRRPVSDFPDEATVSEINEPANLVYLCPNHHWEHDHGLLTL
jgi:predicted restriction endonuclease